MTPPARPLKVAIIAGEPSGDRLGADLLAALKMRHPEGVEIIGVGGDAMTGEGLSSLFDYSELSIVGVSAVLARLPQLVWRIGQAARAIVAARPDVLVVIDSPDFSHRVARKVRKRLPNLPIVNYVCPTVWAWKPHRAKQMIGYIDHVLSILPFEPRIVEALGGPPTTYVGHRLALDPDLLSARIEQDERAKAGLSTGLCLVLPGSRRSELKRLMPVFAQAVEEMAGRHPGMRFVLPAVPRHVEAVRKAVATWPVAPDIVVGEEAKWRAFAEADGALAASGTVLLELALAGVPCVSAYKLDPVANLMTHLIITWSAALPNLVVGYPVLPEYMNESARPGRLARHVERLMLPTLERAAMMEGFEAVRRAMAVTRAPGEHAAEIIDDLLTQRTRNTSAL